ncbi:MAG: hypothetical protein HOZ81_46815 [Streptomyces sp.]|nr:hypothetical protein [Streptomyces sp.]NUS24440.1 hypothetical protein [Streptomyces sp.]
MSDFAHIGQTSGEALAGAPEAAKQLARAGSAQSFTTLALDDETLRLIEVTLEVRDEPEANRKAWFARATVAPGQLIPEDLLKSTPRTLTLPRGEVGQVQVDSITTISGGFNALRLRGHGAVPGAVMNFPSDEEFRWAGPESQLARIQAEIDRGQAEIARTRRGRLALRIGRLAVRWHDRP